MPLTLKGGWWKLSDIVQYEITSTMSIIKTASLYKEKILLFRNDMCRREIQKGTTEPPYYYIVPQEQHDVSELVNMINLLMQHGIKVYTMKENMLIAGRQYNKGDYVVPLAQPYRALIKEVMEAQEYPVRHYTPGGDIIRPYDITSWSLPLHRQVTSFEIKIRNKTLESQLGKIEDELNFFTSPPESFSAAVFSVNNNESFKAAFIALNNDMRVNRLTGDQEINREVLPKGSFVIYNSKKKATYWEEIEKEIKFSPLYITKETSLETTPVTSPRIALVETYFHDMDAGWTRYVLDTYNIPFTLLHPADLQKADLGADYDIIVFPDNSKSRLMTGKSKSEGKYYMSSYAPEYVKGMEKKGKENLLSFMNKGGIILSWGRSTELFEDMLTITDGENKEEFQLPFRDVSSSLKKEGLYVAGALMKITLTKDNPLTYGLPEEIGIFSRGRPVFTTSIPRFDMDRRVVAKYPEKDILMSGYAAKSEKLANKSAMIWMKKGEGQIVLYGFSPQFRASTQASFKLLFNAFFLSD